MCFIVISFRLCRVCWDCVFFRFVWLLFCWFVFRFVCYRLLYCLGLLFVSCMFCVFVRFSFLVFTVRLGCWLAWNCAWDSYWLPSLMVAFCVSWMIWLVWFACDYCWVLFTFAFVACLLWFCVVFIVVCIVVDLDLFDCFIVVIWLSYCCASRGLIAVWLYEFICWRLILVILLVVVIVSIILLGLQWVVIAVSFICFV